MPCNTSALNALAFTTAIPTTYAPEYLGTATQELAATGAPTDGVSSWGVQMQQEGGNAGPPWWWFFGFVVLGISLALGWILGVLAGMFQPLPGVGPSIATLLQQAQAGLGNTLHQWALGQMDGAQHWINAENAFRMGILAQLVQLATAIGWNKTAMVNDYESLYNSSIAHADTLYNDALNAADASDRLLISDYENLHNLALQYTDSETGAERARAQAAEAQLQQDISSISSSALGDAQAALAQAEAYTDLEINALVRPELEQLQQSYISIRQQEEADTQNLQSQITQQGTAFNNAIGAAILPVTTALVGLQTQLQPQVQQLQQQLQNATETCIDPLCETMGDDANGLLNLLQIGGIAAFFAFLAEAIHNPKPTADDTVTVLEPVFSAGGSLVDSLVSFAV